MPALGLARPEALPLLLAALALVALAVSAEVARRRAVETFAGKRQELASVSVARRRAKTALRIGAVALAVVALAGPYVDVVHRSVVMGGVDVVVALDVSQSMAVRDVEPDRLRAAKAFVARLGETLRQSRVALVLFAGEAVVRYPATNDPAVLGGTLDAITTAFRPAGGSSLRSGVDSALQAFAEEVREGTQRKALVLVTDGEDTTSQVADLDALRRRNVRVLSVGVGTPSGGPIPTYDRFGAFSGYLRSGGQEVVSRLNEAPLRAVADGSGGRYWRLAGLGTVNEVATELRRLDVSSLTDAEGGTVPDDRYQTFLILAILLLVADGLIDDRRPMPTPGGPVVQRRRRFALPAFAARVAGVLAVALAVACGPAAVNEAERLYLSGDASAALAKYRSLIAEHPGVAELHVNAGNALVRLGTYGDAVTEYDSAIRTGGQHTRAVAQYQRGVTLYRMGQLEEAREAFKGALRLDPADRDAKFNIEIIDRMLNSVIDQGEEPGTQPASGAVGSPQPGDQGQGQPTSGQPQPSGAPSDAPPDPGTVGPQASGPPSSDRTGEGQSVASALSDFESSLSEEDALRLLDALLNEQRGLELFIEGQRPGDQPQDRAY